jgi:hypothetical protein
MIKALLHALGLDHSPLLSAQWRCPCKLCAAANPDKLTPADRDARTNRAGMCGQWCSREQGTKRTLWCMRASGHEGRCLP